MHWEYPVRSSFGIKHCDRSFSCFAFYIPVCLKWRVQGGKDQGPIDGHSFSVLSKGNFDFCNQIQWPQGCLICAMESNQPPSRPIIISRTNRVKIHMQRSFMQKPIWSVPQHCAVNTAIFNQNMLQKSDEEWEIFAPSNFCSDSLTCMQLGGLIYIWFVDKCGILWGERGRAINECPFNLNT